MLRFFLISFISLAFGLAKGQVSPDARQEKGKPSLLKVGLMGKMEDRLRIVGDFEQFLHSKVSLGGSLGYWHARRMGGSGNHFHGGLEGRYYFGSPRARATKIYSVLYVGFDREHFRNAIGANLRYGSEFGIGIGLAHLVSDRVRLDLSLLPGYEPAVKRIGKSDDGTVYSQSTFRNFFTLYAKLQIGFIL